MAPVSIELLNGLLATAAAEDNILTVVVTLLCFGGNPTVCHTVSILGLDVCVCVGMYACGGWSDRGN